MFARKKRKVGLGRRSRHTLIPDRLKCGEFLFSWMRRDFHLEPDCPCIDEHIKNALISWIATNYWNKIDPKIKEFAPRFRYHSKVEYFVLLWEGKRDITHQNYIGAQFKLVHVVRYERDFRVHYKNYVREKIVVKMDNIIRYVSQKVCRVNLLLCADKRTTITNMCLFREHETNPNCLLSKDYLPLDMFRVLVNTIKQTRLKRLQNFSNFEN